MMDKNALVLRLAEFFLDSLREDAEDVDNWCVQSGNSVDSIVTNIEGHLGLTI